MSDYEQTTRYWDNVFEDTKLRLLESEKSGYPILDDALDWLSESSSKVLDFGSGSGVMLAYLAKRNEGHYFGVDVSSSAVGFATRLFAMNNLKSGYFEVGSVAALRQYDARSFDAIILSNVLDNVRLEDAMAIVKETTRLLKEGGKLLIKLNLYNDAKAIAESKLERLATDFYLEPSGLYLLNKPDAFWLDVLGSDYTIHKHEIVHFTEHHRNRMFLCVKNR